MLDWNEHSVFRDDARRRNNKMKRQRHAPALAVYRRSAGKPEKDRREEGAGVPVGESSGKQSAPMDGLSPLRQINGTLTAREYREKSPHSENQERLNRGSPVRICERHEGP